MDSKAAIYLLKNMLGPLVDYAEMVGGPPGTYGVKYVYQDPEDYAIKEAIKALEIVNKYKWHDLKNNPSDLPELFVDFEIEEGKFSDKVFVETDKYNTLMVAYANLSTNEWFNPLNEDECFEEEYGNVVKWKYIDQDESNISSEEW